MITTSWTFLTETVMEEKTKIMENYQIEKQDKSKVLSIKESYDYQRVDIKVFEFVFN